MSLYKDKGFCSWWCKKEWCSDWEHKKGYCLNCGEKMDTIEWDDNGGFCSKECLSEYLFRNGYHTDGFGDSCLNCMTELDALSEEDNVANVVVGYGYDKCTHDDVTKVMKIGECEIWAGSKYEVEDALRHGMDFDMVISLEGTKLMKAPKRVTINGEIPLKRTAGTPYAVERTVPTLAIDWTDYKAPDLGYDFWEDLTKDLKELKGKVAVFCVGGHGRTGTFLSILRGMFHPKGDPVKWVREKYCKKAVESKEQIEYIEWMTGLDVKEEPSKSYGVKGSSYNTTYVTR